MRTRSIMVFLSKYPRIHSYRVPYHIFKSVWGFQLPHRSSFLKIHSIRYFQESILLYLGDIWFILSLFLIDQEWVKIFVRLAKWLYFVSSHGSLGSSSVINKYSLIICWVLFSYLINSSMKIGDYVLVLRLIKSRDKILIITAFKALY